IYRFPPISILAKAAPINESGAQEELAQNARKLVDTLMSFKVKTKILSVSRGPTITRYELSPEAGTRVRSIANLVDDIALNLATSGVRIEAPIPGKSAVGIEVPNKNVSTVRLRELIDSNSFKNAESKLNVALGVDVAGTPVYCNIAKMPHMLIAGATGMGKSVCINSIISSILYKATPDEVKLILVDPKKVEFNIYNGLPHLLVPVVSDPQKAAGSLNWAVGEMERRFSLIDEVGVRDITGYNEITKNDPDREPMPYVVIIIDELADLMMTAPDAVETSICRLAQKARAAGMHLVIGTQRPSVDVITGLIKANIPSRIAFTVASQVDSKTIIDIGGAEKLIGRGDMLYAPVGFMKPLRVQGAFVSDEEVRALTDFIRSEGGFIEYDPDIISSIEREAERCAQKGKSGSGDFDEDELRENVDPKFREALEIAVNAGKISTSLLQRNLSVGYGRAAKIIDRMQALGYVSPPDGQKPREVLITKQMYMEMVVNGEEI
ncbi:MAG: DNA translocase FtsK, partial [Clostridia bacterium]|nr:DNA translocase FtsK [Clostridia bacterium]